MVPARQPAAPLQQVIAQRGQQALAAQRPQKPQPRQTIRAAQPTISPLAAALEARGRRFRVFPFPGLKSGYIGILYASGRDVESALFGAHKSLAVLAANGAAGLTSDRDAIALAKQREILYALTCEALDDTRLKTTLNTGKPYPAFTSPRWMGANLGPDDEAALMALVAEVRAEFAPRGSEGMCGPEEWDDAEQLDAMAALLTDGADLAHLAHLGRAEVTSLCVALARRLVDVMKARDALMAEHAQEAVDDHQREIEEAVRRFAPVVP